MPQVYYCDDGAFLSEDLAGIQLAVDCIWVVSRVLGLTVKIKPKDGELNKREKCRVGTKTAWIGTYYDVHGTERPVTGHKVMTPTEEEVPQVDKYTHLGTPLGWSHEGRNTEARVKVRDKCVALLRLIGRVDALGPRQVV